MSNKERYIEWCKTASLPLTMQPEWMEAVCAGKQWDVLLATDNEGHIKAALPYLLRKRLGMRYIIMPQQTPVGGIWIAPELADDRWQVAEICRQLSEQLRALRLSYYFQQYPVGSIVPQAMKALGYRLQERTTYRIEFPGTPEELIAHFSKNKRRQLQRAQSLVVSRDMDGEQFYRFHASCMREQRKQISYTREFLLVLERKLTRQHQCQFLSINDDKGHTHAAAFLVWDKHTLYYLIPCYSPTFKDSGAGALLAFEAIKLARELHLAFDFEGSMHPGTARHYSEFGTTPTTYYGVERCYNPLFRLFLWGNKMRELRYK